MKTFKNLDELKAADVLILNDITSCMHEDDRALPFLSSIGGDVFVIETLEDLVDVKDSNGVSIADAVGIFDSVEVIGHADEYILCITINNNNGGPSYFIPKEVSDQCEHVVNSLELFEGF